MLTIQLRASTFTALHVNNCKRKMPITLTAKSNTTSGHDTIQAITQKQVFYVI